MAIGRTFPESLQKALRSLETGRLGLNADPGEAELDGVATDELVRAAATPTPERLFLVEAALRRGVGVDRLHEVTGIDPWFLDQISLVAEARTRAGGDLGLRAVAPGVAGDQAPRLRRPAARAPVGRRHGRRP